jgi:hypothetical protein
MEMMNLFFLLVGANLGFVVGVLVTCYVWGVGFIKTINKIEELLND